MHNEVGWLRRIATDFQISQILTQRDELLRRGNEHDKRIRAEVLAAAILAVGHLKNENVSTTTNPDRDGKPLSQCVYYCPACKLEKLQPAASALEELLREAELKGLKFALDAAGGWDEYVTDTIEGVIQKRIAELEKARAILDKP